MGCDIHMFIERRDESGKWQFVDNRVEKVASCPVCDGTGKLPNDGSWRWPGEECFRCKGAGYCRDPYHSRNYDLFGMLADVRNGTWGTRFVPICQPKGLPDDISQFLRGEMDDDYLWLGDHSFSWLTVAELLAYDWTRVNRKRGCVHLSEAVAWRKSGQAAPSSYCAGSSSREVSAEEMRKLVDEEIAAGRDGKGKPVCAYMDWDESYADLAGSFYSHVLPALQKMGSPDDVRIVFGFDS